MATAEHLDEQVDALLSLLAELGRQIPLGDPVGGISGGRSELTSQQLHSLLWLGRDGELTSGTLAQRIGTADSTCTGIVDRLAERGLVERLRDKGDRRVVVIRLTPAGKAQHRALQEASRQRIAGILALLRPTDRRALLAIVERLVNSAVEGRAPRPHSGVRKRSKGGSSESPWKRR